MKVLVVEDEGKVGRFVERGLAELTFTAKWVQTCAAARDALCETRYDALVVDLGLPDGDGLDLLREWRQAGFDEPVIILSARDTVQDRIRGLDLGADDYLPKPFSFEELVARLRSLLRRRQQQKRPSSLDHRGMRLDLHARVVTIEGRQIEVTSREFALLELFMQNPGRVLTRTMIAERIWERSYDMETNLIDVYMRKLRTKLETSPDRPLFKTLRGVGYKLL